jgi:hypothetical protein
VLKAQRKFIAFEQSCFLIWKHNIPAWLPSFFLCLPRKSWRGSQDGMCDRCGDCFGITYIFISFLNVWIPSRRLCQESISEILHLYFCHLRDAFSSNMKCWILGILVKIENGKAEHKKCAHTTAGVGEHFWELPQTIFVYNDITPKTWKWGKTN